MKPIIKSLPVWRTSFICSSVLILAACATKPKVPEIAYDNFDYSPAVVEADPPMPVEIVELPKALPLPGQLKPMPGKIGKSEKTKTRQAASQDPCGRCQ